MRLFPALRRQRWGSLAHMLELSRGGQSSRAPSIMRSALTADAGLAVTPAEKEDAARKLASLLMPAPQQAAPRYQQHFADLVYNLDSLRLVGVDPEWLERQVVARINTTQSAATLGQMWPQLELRARHLFDVVQAYVGHRLRPDTARVVLWAVGGGWNSWREEQRVQLMVLLFAREGAEGSAREVLELFVAQFARVPAAFQRTFYRLWMRRFGVEPVAAVLQVMEACAGHPQLNPASQLVLLWEATRGDAYVVAAAAIASAGVRLTPLQDVFIQLVTSHEVTSRLRNAPSLVDTVRRASMRGQLHRRVVTASPSSSLKVLFGFNQDLLRPLEPVAPAAVAAARASLTTLLQGSANPDAVAWTLAHS